MTRPAGIATLLLLALAGPAVLGDAPGWRGDGAGIVRGGGFPVDWSHDRNVTWRVRLSGHGHSSPIVHGDAVVLVVSNGDGTQRSVLCFDRADGELRWRQTFTTEEPEPTHRRNGYASATPVTDGERVYVFLGSIGAAAVALDDGEIAWRRRLDVGWGELGAASGLRLHEDLLFVQHGAGEAAAVEALSLRSGETVWRRDLAHAAGAAGPDAGPAGAVLATPTIRRSPVGAELIVAAPGRIVALNPLTGRPFWHSRGLGATVFASPTLGDDHLAVGDGDGGLMAMQLPAAQTGDVTDAVQLWRRDAAPSNARPHLATGVIVGRRLFTADAHGTLECIALETGEVLWRRDLDADVWASLLAAEGRLYVTDMSGTTHVIRAADRFDKLRTNTLAEGDHVTATPAFSDGQIFLRTANHLYCIGPPAAEGDD